MSKATAFLLSLFRLQKVWLNGRAPWCGPCRMLGPVLEKAAETLPDGVQIVKYNVDECQDVASQLGVRGIPTLAVYKDGQLQAQQAGAMNSAQFSEFLKNFI